MSMEHLTVPESKEMLTMEAYQKQKAKTNTIEANLKKPLLAKCKAIYSTG